MPKYNRYAFLAALLAASWVRAQTVSPGSVSPGNGTVLPGNVTITPGNVTIVGANRGAVPSGGTLTLTGAITTSSAGTSFTPGPDTSRSEKKTAAQLADSDWHYLEVLMTPPFARPALVNLTTAPDQKQSMVEIEVDRLHKASLEAREFYTKHPTDARAARARKYETLTELQAVQLGGSAHQAKASALAAAYRGDKRIPASDRFDVAVAAESLALAPALKAKAVNDRGSLQEDLADRLAVEFGDDPVVYHHYVNVMRTNDDATAQRVATKLTLKNSPAQAKAEALKVIASGARNVGKPVTLTLKKATGTTLTVGAGAGQPTVLFFWSKDTAERDFAALQAVKNSTPAGMKWVYIALGASAQEADATGKIPFGGEFCAEPLAFASPTAQQFNIIQTPYVCVLDSAGKLSGSGRVAQLTSLLNAVK
jgi:hypothetical protein